MSDEVWEYYQKNKEKVDELALHGDVVIRAMALAIKKVAGDVERQRNRGKK
jgi:hypothetical protein